MEPTLSAGDRLLVAPTGLAPYRRGSLVVVADPRDPARRSVKRVVGLAGEVIELRAGRLHVDERPWAEPYLDELAAPDTSDARWEVGARQLVVLGDNRRASTDSRTYGAVPATEVVATVVASVSPPRWLPAEPPRPAAETPAAS